MLKKGDKSPDFSGTDQFGNVIDSSIFLGKRTVLYFYPKDDTPGCTKEACNLRDNYDLLLSRGLAVVGVSPDSEPSHQKFSEKYNLPFPLLSDPELKIIKAFGVWGKKNMYGRIFDGLLRTTFVIDENGIIEEVIKKVKTDDHTKQIIPI
ncbi:thioredoxin-dependent thiol peroxidase [Bacteroidales bacterium]